MMIRNKTIVTLFLIVMALGLSSNQAVTAQVQTHLQGPTSPTASQIRAFCKQYRVAGTKYKARYKAQFSQYCANTSNLPASPQTSFNKPAANPPAAHINQLWMPKCLAKNSQIRVTGQNFSTNTVSCTTEPALALRLFSQTISTLRFQVKTTPQAKSSYRIRCTAGQQTLTSRWVNTCLQKNHTAKTNRVRNMADQQLPDLAGTLALLPPTGTIGYQQQGIRIEYRNLGKGRNSSRFAIEITLSSTQQKHLNTKAAVLFSRKALVRQTLQSNTVPAPGDRHAVFASMRLPKILLPGDYRWCVRLDTRTRIPESNENNNRFCLRQRLGKSPTPSTKRSNIFGNKRPKAPIQAGLQPPFRGGTKPPLQPVRQFLQTLPEGLRTLDGGIPLLVLNRRILGPVSIPITGTAELSWVIPEAAGDQMFLVISENNRYVCPAGPLDTHRTELEALSLSPDAGVKSREDETTLNLGAYGRPRTYYLWGCVIQSGTLTGIKTNIISMRFGFSSATVAGSHLLPRPIPPGSMSIPAQPTARTDLTIREIRKVSDRRLFFWVGATRPGIMNPPLQAFAWKITIINLAQFLSITSSETLATLEGDDRNVFIFQGEGRIREMGLLGIGDMITTNVNNFSSRSWAVLLQINPGPHRPDDPDRVALIVDADRPDYRESNYQNNNKTIIIGNLHTNSLGILGLNVVNSGPGWAIFSLHYLKRTFDAIVVKLLLRNRDADPRHDLKIDCTNGPEGYSFITAEFGERIAYFHCRRPDGAPVSFVYSQAIARLDAAYPPPHTTRRYAYRTYNIDLDWSQPNRPGPSLSDLVAGINRVETGVAGFGGTIEVSITSHGVVTARNVSSRFGLSTIDGLRRYARWLIFPEIRVGQTLTQTIQIPGRIEHVSGNIAGWVVDPDNREVESNETNNILDRTMPGARRIGQVSLTSSSVATGKFTGLQDRRGVCPDAVGGHTWPTQLRASPRNQVVLVGYRIEYDDGVFCDSTWMFAAHGFVDFPVDRYRTIGTMLSSAVLYFQPLGFPPVRNTCRQPQVRVSAANNAWQRLGTVFTYRASPVATTVRSNLGTGGRYAADVSRIVRRWLTDGGAHFGFRLTPDLGRHNVNTSSNCTGYYGNFELVLVFGDF